MSEFSLTVHLDKDNNGRLRRTRSGHYRFDLVMLKDARPIFVAHGLRLDHKLRHILPITIQRGSTTYVVAEVMPGEHDNLSRLVCEMIDDALLLERASE